MARGGGTRSGPAPDPEALRRERDEGSWISLPAEGRGGRAPSWPLSKATVRERTLWNREWKRPQAVMWQKLGLEVEVALYVRSLVDAEKRDASVASRTLIRQQQEALGISVPGLARNKWRIKELGKPTTTAKSRGRAGSSRTRFKVVDGGRS